MCFFILTGVLDTLILSNLPKLHRGIPELNNTDKYWEACQRHCYWGVDQRGAEFIHVQTCPRQHCVSFMQVPTLPTILKGKNRDITSGTLVWITMPWNGFIPVYICLWLPGCMFKFGYNPQNYIFLLFTKCTVGFLLNAAVENLYL